MALHADLTDYRQTLRLFTSQPYQPIAFNGLEPILVLQRKLPNILVQSGFAVGWKKCPRPTAPLFPTLLIERPEINVEPADSSEIEWRRTWTYVMAVDATYTQPDLVVSCAWPENPVFDDVP